MNKLLNLAFLGIAKRAETSARERLIQTFVDVGPLFTLLNSLDHQVIFGRRGTGKTHALQFLADSREKAGDVVVVIDLRTVGSNNGMYADQTIPLAERATTMLVDTLVNIHDALVEFSLLHSEELNLAEFGPLLDGLATAITEVKVVGDVEEEQRTQSKKTSVDGGAVGVSGSGNGPKVDISMRSEKSESDEESASVKRSGVEKLYLNFGTTSSAFKKITGKLKGRRLWILIDEWSSIPLEIQPFLADLFRRTLFPLSGLTVKMAAIEFRSSFQVKGSQNDYIGIELGADASADVNLDDFMVFDNDPERAKEFFQNLISSHVRAVCSDNPDLSSMPTQNSALLNLAFTEKRALEEFVRACEGVPRDAINILNLSAQKALESPISVGHVRQAARIWYQRDKEKAACADTDANTLLHTIIDEVIGDRRARAFLLRSDIRHRIIDNLYDSRVLHVLKKGMSSKNQPGVRYDAYKLDYGCYVDLLSTQKMPLGLFPLEYDSSDEDKFVDVPPDDYRSIRRAILDPAQLKSRGKNIQL
jgi:hypothetical protein